MDASKTKVEQAIARWAQTQGLQWDTWHVAYSGGMDSHVLLLALHQYLSVNPVAKLVAIHVDHGLQPSSVDWALHCQSVCHSLGVVLHSKKIDGKPLPGDSIEAFAREQRYAIFQSIIAEQGVLLCAHHRDDQAETLLLQLMRASGAKGLRAMVPSRAHQGFVLERPLLSCSQRAVAEFADKHQLSWVQDPSNHDHTYLRNFIRHKILPELKQKVAGVDKAFAHSAAHLAECYELSQELAKSDYASVSNRRLAGLDNAALARLSLARQKNVIRYWLEQQNAPSLPMGRLNSLIAQISAKPDRMPEICWDGYCIRRYQDIWMIAQETVPNMRYVYPWQEGRRLALNQRQFDCKQRLGQGVAFASTDCFEIRPAGRLASIKPNGRPTRAMKKWWQSYKVPPWLRESWPCLYRNGQLAAVCGLFTLEGFACKRSEPGLNVDLTDDHFIAQK